MKTLDLAALVVPEEIKFIPDPEKRHKKMRDWFKENLTEKILASSGLVFRYGDLKFMIGFMSSRQWFFAGIPGKIRVINIDSFIPSSAWMDVYEAMNKLRNHSEEIAQILIYLYEQRDVLFSAQKQVKTKEKVEKAPTTAKTVKNEKKKVK